MKKSKILSIVLAFALMAITLFVFTGCLFLWYRPWHINSRKYIEGVVYSRHSGIRYLRWRMNAIQSRGVDYFEIDISVLDINEEEEWEDFYDAIVSRLDVEFEADSWYYRIRYNASHIIIPSGAYRVRIRSINGNRVSVWSTERFYRD